MNMIDMYQPETGEVCLEHVAASLRYVCISTNILYFIYFSRLKVGGLFAVSSLLSLLCKFTCVVV